MIGGLISVGRGWVDGRRWGPPLCEAGAGEIADLGWSDHQGQLVESSEDPQVYCFLGPEFIVTAAEVPDGGMPGADHVCAAELLEAAHRPESGL
jgi:hypothetical protein